MMKIKLFLLVAMLVPSMLSTMAQEKKQFTLEDLNYGGRNYSNMIPNSKYYTWWGSELVRLDVEECYLVDKKTGRETLLLDTARINDIISADDHLRVRHMYNVEFPDAGKTVA